MDQNTPVTVKINLKTCTKDLRKRCNELLPLVEAMRTAVDKGCNSNEVDDRLKLMKSYAIAVHKMMRPLYEQVKQMEACYRKREQDNRTIELLQIKSERAKQQYVLE